MKKIYYLYLVRYEDTDDEDVKVIGIYSSRKQAKLAIERMKKNGIYRFSRRFSDFSRCY